MLVYIEDVPQRGYFSGKILTNRSRNCPDQWMHIKDQTDEHIEYIC